MSDKEALIQQILEKQQAQEKNELIDKIMKTGGKPAPEKNFTPTLQEMHPDFTTVDRLKVKNLSNSPSAAVNYLQQKHPTLEISLSKDDQIRARKRDGSEKEYRVLDPDTGIFSSDILRDVGDVLWDVGAGVATGAATAAGGLVGALGGGVGALPTAALAGAGSSSAIEALRQGAGLATGVSKDFSGMDVGIAGGAGALSPLLLGTGATAVKAAAPAAARTFGGKISQGIGAGVRGLAEMTEAPARKMVGAGLKKAIAEGGEEAINQAQRGVIGRAAGASAGLARDAMSKISGTPRGALEAVATQGELLEHVSKRGNLTPYLDDVMDTVTKDVSALKRGHYDRMASKIAGIDSVEKVDYGPVKQIIHDKIAKTQVGKQTAIKIEKRERLKGLLKEHFMHEVDTIVDGTPTQAWDDLSRDSIEDALELQSTFGHMAGYNRQSTIRQAGSNISAGAEKIDKEFEVLAKHLRKKLGEQIKMSAPEDALDDLAKYGEVREMEKGIEKLTQGTNQMKSFRTLRNADIASNAPIQEFMDTVDDAVGKNTFKEAQELMKGVEVYGGKAPSVFSPVGDVWRRGSIPAAATGAVLGGAVGYYGSGNAMSGAGASVAGGALGAIFGGPQMMRSMINQSLRSKALHKTLGPLSPGAAGQFIRQPISTWLEMEQNNGN